MDLFIYTYLLLLGFFIYATAKQRWNQLHIVAKVCVIPAMLIFGAADVVFNIVVGSALYAAPPTQVTFSDRLCERLHDDGWRGVVTRFIAAVLNSIYPGHITYRMR